jgi:hypothetical protein
MTGKRHWKGLAIGAVVAGGTFHRALDDAKYTAEVFFKLSEQLGPDATLGDVIERAGNVVAF